MAEYIFGSGTVIAKRTDLTNQPPILFGTLQDITLDFSRKIESLVGQYMSPVAFAGGELEITGKAKYARFQAAAFNNAFFGQTQNANAGLEMAITEAVIPVTTSFTVINHSTFVEDLGLFYAGGANNGQQLTPVPLSPAVGQYIPGAAGTGSYTVATGDETTPMLVYYSYGVSTENELVLTNQLMGPVPNFELYIKESFTYFGAAKSLVVKLNACVSQKLALAFTNTKFAIPELDIMAGADASNNIGFISMTE
jgi:hypothetical protein